MRKPVFRLPTSSETNQAVQPQKMVKAYLTSRGIVLCSKNNSADQLLGYHVADLWLFFSHMHKSRFPHDMAHSGQRTCFQSA